MPIKPAIIGEAFMQILIKIFLSILFLMAISGGCGKGEVQTLERNTQIIIEYAEPRQVSELSDERINEASGIARSNITAGNFWVHNDSGDGPNLFLINMKGETIVSGPVEGAKARDWEDIASFQLRGNSYLLVADVGDNPEKRKKYQLYLLKEPVPDEKGEISVPFKLENKIIFKYEDGSHNCESIAVDTSFKKIYLVSKKSEDECKVYELPLSFEEEKEVITAIAIADLKIPTAVAMDISGDGRRAVILSKKHAYEFTRSPDESWAEAFAREPGKVKVPEQKQGEAVCYGMDGKTLYFVSEHAFQPLWKMTVKK